MSQILTLGSRGQDVATLQRLLKVRGAALDVDGDFGEETEQAVRAFQRAAGLVDDGRAGPKTLAALQGGDCSRLLQRADLLRAAQRLDLPLATVYAVNEVESLGEGFLANGRAKILYERHQMRRQLQSNRPDLDIEALALRTPNLVNAKPGGYAGGTAEWQRLGHARQIDDPSALESTSWGAFQIMGYHWPRLGYASAADLVAAMGRSESAQFDAFVRFIETDPALHKALRARKWAQFARRYNGPAYAQNLYDVKLARAYDRHAACGCAAA